ncbi:MAG: glycosyltransferase family 1 protein [bacterium]|nr:glycosyltransferase family 1 protein [bacterium]
MRIGIDCRTLLSPEKGEKAGVGHYTYYLVKHLLKHDKKNTYVLFFDHRSPKLKEFKQKNTEIVKFKMSEYKRYLPYAYSHVFVSKVLNEANLDIFHSPANVIPMKYKKPSIVTIHDLAIYSHPEWFPSKQNFSINVLVPKSIEKAEHVIAVSESTEKDLKRLFNVSKKKVSVVYEGVTKVKAPSKLSMRRTLKKWKLADRYLFYIGTLEPRKNIAGIIQSFDELALEKLKKYKDMQLVIAGAKGFEFQDNYNAIKNAKSGKIRYIGYVTEKEKIALLNNAEAFIFPSHYEGFGLPVLEAMSYGIPVITSNVSSLPEVAGKAAELIDPSSLESLKKGIHKVITRKATRTKLAKSGKKQAKKFSWDKCAKQTLKIYKKVYKENYS